MAPPSDPGGQPMPSGEDDNSTEEGISLECFFAMLGFIVHTVADDGDVDLGLERGELRVSSDVLMKKSPVFKAMLGLNFREGQEPRSAANPLTIKLEDDDTESMAIFCVLLHKGVDEACLNIYDKVQATPATTRLARLAIVIDKYAAVDQLTDEEVTALFGPFMPRNGEYELDLEKASDLAVAAYLLHQSDLFSLFTRRLILDYNKQLSMLKYMEFFTHIPTFGILQLEDQRAFMHARIDSVVSCASMRPCFHCPKDTYDHKLADAIAQKLKPKKNHWPPDYMKQHTLRDAMNAIGSLGNYTAFKDNDYALCHKHKNWSTSKAKWFLDGAIGLNKSAEGLCYACTREGKHATQCKHRENLHERMHELDHLDARSLLHTGLFG